MFSFGCALPSPTSAESCPSLFGWFTGSTAQSDFSNTCASALWFMAFAGRPWLSPQGVLEILPVLVHVVLSACRVLRLRRTGQPLAYNAAAVLPSYYSPCSRHPDKSHFTKLNSRAHWFLCLRFNRRLSTPPPSLEAEKQVLRCAQDDRS